MEQMRALQANMSNKEHDLQGRVAALSKLQEITEQQVEELRKNTMGFESEATGGTVFIGNLAYGTGAAELREAFMPIGNVRRIQVVRKSGNGWARGHAFVEFSCAEGKQRLLSMQGLTVGGREIRTAEPRVEPAPGRRTGMQGSWGTHGIEEIYLPQKAPWWRRREGGTEQRGWEREGGQERRRGARQLQQWQPAARRLHS
jgi:hypothetical protein